MGLFRRKPKVSIEEFCQQFYDSLIFNPVISGEDVCSDFWEGVFNSIVEDDRSFALVDPTLFRREIITLRIELCGLAWMHHIQLDKYLSPEILYTKYYLQKNERLEIWDSMADYNEAIAQGMDRVTKPVQRDFEPLARFEDIQQAHISFMKRLRADIFDKWLKETGDSECATRLANRISTDSSWVDKPIVEMLSTTLMRRLGCQLNAKACLGLQAVIRGLYDGAKEALKDVSIQL